MFRDFFVEGNREEQEWEKQGLSSKTIAMRKSSSRRARFDSGITHTNHPRENTTAWARPGTGSYNDSINRQRKNAHRAARRRRKPRPGSSPEDRQMQATWDRLLPDDRKKGKYETMQDKKRRGLGAGIAAERNAILARGEKRRMLRTSAVNAIRRALGGGYVDEAFKQANYIKMLRQEKRHARRAFEIGPDPEELSGKYRSISKNRYFKMNAIRDALMRGEDPRNDTRGGAYAERGNPNVDHRAAFTTNQDFMPSYKPRRTKKPGVNQKENIKEKNNLLFVESNRKSQLASKRGRKPKDGPRSRQDDEPRAIVTVGLPGSGKSTIARHMVARGDTDQHEFDKSRRELGMGPADFSPALAAHTFSGARRSAEQGRNTALTNTTIPKPHRQDAVQKLRDAGYQNVDVVLSPGSTKAAMRRNRKRTGKAPGEGAVPQFVMNRMAQGMENISRSELRAMRNKYKELHKQYRFTKPAMKRSGALRESMSFLEFLEETRAARVSGLDRRSSRAYERQVAADRRAAARERAEERQAELEAKIDDLLRQHRADTEYVQARRENPEILRREAAARRKKKQQESLPERMARAAARQGIED
jgi:predicted kinase